MAIVEMKTAKEAQKLIEGLNNTPMDKSHTFHLYKYSEVVNCLQNEDDELPTKEWRRRSWKCSRFRAA